MHRRQRWRGPGPLQHRRAGHDDEPEISEDTEVWLDFTVDDGAATSTASVPFVPLPGDHSVVIHALATDHDTGLAGARLACLPVVW